MPSALPVGDPVPEDGALPRARWRASGTRPFGFYVHVPFCTVRCGYCDFNTYTADELGPAGGAPGASRATYAEAAIAEVRRARRRAGRRRPPGRARSSSAAARRRCCSPADLGVDRGVDRRASSGWPTGAEVTTESNPDSVALWDLERAARGRLQPDLVRHAVRGRPRAQGPRPHPRPAAGAGRRRRGRGQAGLRAGQPGPDLRHAGGVARRLGDSASRRRWPARPTTSRRTR